MKKLGIVTIKEEAGYTYAHQIEGLIKGRLPVTFYSFEKDNVDHITEDVILLSTHLHYDAVVSETMEHCEIVIPKMTLEKDVSEKLGQIPEGSDAYLYNLSAEMAIDTISLLQQIGLNHINFIPSFPGQNMIERVPYIITPGESEGIQSNKPIIDIGIRVLDLSTILDVLARLGLSHQVDEHGIQKYFKEVSSVSTGIEKLIRETSDLEFQFDILLNAIDDYIVVTNSYGYVYFHGNKFKTFIQNQAESLIGCHLSELIMGIDFDAVYSKRLPRSEFVVKINDIDTILEIRSILLHGTSYFIHKLKRFSQSEHQLTQLRKKVYEMGHTSKYTFEDIKGESDAIKESVHIARRMANSVSSVLIIGETGTGKELFAQAIHNASPRSDGAFVAVNCGVFNENLFESELFGYEEGSFTGAKKGGKQGLFEIAHKGTIFLDEIGEMDLNLQSKLLRVIQEKRIRRVGSENIIDVDVRIIAATNRELMEEVRSGTFRKDLYYRLNVLPLTLAPLKDRKEDIEVVFKSICEELGCHYALSDAAWTVMLDHDWEGNIRELRNIAEYLNNLGLSIIEVKDLPKTIKHGSLNGHIKSQARERDEKVQEKPLDINRLILKILEEAYHSHKKLGRKSIAESLMAYNIYLSEQEVRKHLLALQDLDYVESSRGRGGTRITASGINALRNIMGE